VQQPLGVEALHQRVRGEQADQRARRGAADRIDARLLALLEVEMANGEREAGGGAGLIGAERGAAGEGQIEAKRCDLPEGYPGGGYLPA
jgi:hypothetical protein